MQSLIDGLLALLLADGQGSGTIKELLGLADVSTTMIYTQILNRGQLGVRSPLIRLAGL